MKKILAFVFATLLVSCSDDDTPTLGTNTEGTRLVKSVLINPDGGISTGEYFYSGTHVSAIISSGSTTTFGYTGDLITAVSISNSGTQATLEYDEHDRLIRTSFSNYSSVYVYNDDDSVTVTDYEGAELPENIDRVCTLFYEDGEVVKKVVTRPGSPDITTYTMTHDNYNNSHLSLTGYYGAYFYSSYSIGAMGRAHNIKTMTTDVTGSTTLHGFYAYEYDYNSFGYPTQQRQVDQEGNPTGYIVNFYYQ